MGRDIVLEDIPLAYYCKLKGIDPSVGRMAARRGTFKEAFQKEDGHWYVPINCEWMPNPVGQPKKEDKKRVRKTRKIAW